MKHRQVEKLKCISVTCRPLSCEKAVKLESQKEMVAEQTFGYNDRIVQI
jgi:hypothetical protein